MRFLTRSFLLLPFAFCLAFCGCEVNAPSLDSIRDTGLFDRRIKETPRQKVIRECQQESDRFRIGCKHCHTTDKAEAIQPPQTQLTAAGQRARIMRTSPTFGLNANCTVCHQSKFRLTRTAEKLFSAGGAKFGEAQKALKPEP
jgi:hypothetical protein